MNGKWSGFSTISIFVGLTVLGFLSILSGSYLIWYILQLRGVNVDYWTVIGALSTAGAAAAVLGGIYIAHRELSEISSTRHMEVANQLFEELNSPENVEARRWIYQNLAEKPEEGILSLSKEGQDAVKRVLNSLDHVAFLTQAGWIPDELVMPWMHPMVAKAWEKLEPYVMYERQRRNEPYYYIKVSTLAERCNAWRKVNLADAEIKWIKNAL